MSAAEASMCISAETDSEPVRSEAAAIPEEILLTEEAVRREAAAVA